MIDDKQREIGLRHSAVEQAIACTPSGVLDKVMEAADRIYGFLSGAPATPAPTTGLAAKQGGIETPTQVFEDALEAARRVTREAEEALQRGGTTSWPGGRTTPLIQVPASMLASFESGDLIRELDKRGFACVRLQEVA